MTGIQELQDEVLGLEAQLAGKNLELAMALGHRHEANQYRLVMETKTKTRMAFRMACGTSDGGCYFNAAGDAGRVVLEVAR